MAHLRLIVSALLVLCLTAGSALAWVAHGQVSDQHHAHQIAAADHHDDGHCHGCDGDRDALCRILCAASPLMAPAPVVTIVLTHTSTYELEEKQATMALAIAPDPYPPKHTLRLV